MKNLIRTLTVFFGLQPMRLLAFTIPDPTGGLFDKTTKIYFGFTSASWLITTTSLLIAGVWFISAGNYATKGQPGKCIGSIIGCILALLGPYFIALIQK